MTTHSEKPQEISSWGDSLDWDALRLRSLAPGGFGAARAYIWPRLLNVDVNLTRPAENEKEHELHRDERQIRLDTDRSFVLYPVDDGPEDTRLARQAELNKLIVQLFRRRPGLNYFQGFHDIATVFQLTLPPEVALHALEKLSLHRLRDSMGHTLEPLTGLMLILQRLLQLADPPFATLLDEHSPLPYSALPHLLTLFAHATPTLPLIQHIFDFLLVRPPLAIVYLVAAVTLLRKDQVLKLCNGGGDDGMIHSILTGLPKFTDYSEVHSDALPDPEPAAAIPEYSNATPLSRSADDSSLREVPKGAYNISNSHLHMGASLPPSPGFVPGPILVPPTVCTEAGISGLNTCSPQGMPSTVAEGDDSVSSIPHPETSISAPLGAPASVDPADIPLPPSAASTPPGSPTHSEFLDAQTIRSLLNVLLLADDLFVRFPPSTPQLLLTRTLGPASAMRTWARDAKWLPSDDQAEAFVVAGIDIVVRDTFEPSPRKKEPQQRAKKGGMRKARKGEARLLVAGAVLVLGAAVVVGIHSRRGGGQESDWRTLFDTLGMFGERMLGIFGEAQLGV